MGGRVDRLGLKVVVGARQRFGQGRVLLDERQDLRGHRPVPVEQVFNPGHVHAGLFSGPVTPVPRRFEPAGPQQGNGIGTAGRHALVHAARRFIDGVLGHDPVGGPFSAGHHHEARHRVGHHVFTRKLGRGVVLSRQERTEPGVDALDVLPGQGPLEHLVDVFKDVVDVLAGRCRMSFIQMPVSVRGADDPVSAPRNDEEHRFFGPQNQADG
ncbi:hypothetical protein D9M72_421400 [compost metagenome]